MRRGHATRRSPPASRLRGAPPPPEPREVRCKGRPGWDGARCGCLVRRGWDGARCGCVVRRGRRATGRTVRCGRVARQQVGGERVMRVWRTVRCGCVVVLL
eukprot:7042923-Prymnesium_polylepis.1